MEFVTFRRLSRLADKIKALLSTKANDNSVVKLSGDQTVNGRKRFKNIFINDNLELVTDKIANNNLLTLHFLDGNSQTTHAARYIGFFLNKTRTGYLGYSSSSHSNFAIVNSTGGFGIDCRGPLIAKTNGSLEVTAPGNATISLGSVTATVTSIIVTSIGEIKFVTNRDLVFEVANHIKLANQRQIKNVQNPSDRQDAATKAYIDDMWDAQKQAIKGIVARSTDFNQFKHEIANW